MTVKYILTRFRGSQCTHYNNQKCSRREQPCTDGHFRWSTSQARNSIPIRHRSRTGTRARSANGLGDRTKARFIAGHLERSANLRPNAARPVRLLHDHGQLLLLLGSVRRVGGRVTCVGYAVGGHVVFPGSDTAIKLPLRTAHARRLRTSTAPTPKMWAIKNVPFCFWLYSGIFERLLRCVYQWILFLNGVMTS